MDDYEYENRDKIDQVLFRLLELRDAVTELEFRVVMLETGVSQRPLSPPRPSVCWPMVNLE
jgi:hypothetical protein